MTDTPAVAATLVVSTPAHLSALQKFEKMLHDGWAEFQKAIGVVEDVVIADAPAAAEVAEGVEVATGNAELAPLTAGVEIGAVAGATALKSATNATDATALATGVQSLITVVSSTIETAKGVPATAPAATQ